MASFTNVSHNTKDWMCSMWCMCACCDTLKTRLSSWNTMPSDNKIKPEMIKMGNNYITEQWRNWDFTLNDKTQWQEDRNLMCSLYARPFLNPQKKGSARVDSQLHTELSPAEEQKRKVAGSETREQGKTEREEESETSEFQFTVRQDGLYFYFPLSSLSKHTLNKRR